MDPAHGLKRGLGAESGALGGATMLMLATPVGSPGAVGSLTPTGQDSDYMSDVRGGTVTDEDSTTIAKKPSAQIQEAEYKAPDTMHVGKNAI